jgi:hypothetical protein
MADLIQLRRDTAANWTSINPTLAQGEPGLETDTGKIKYGNGSTAWNSLGYAYGTALVTTTTPGLAPATGFNTLAYAATTNLDMAALDQQYKTLTLTGDALFTTSNRANGRMVSIRILPGASQRTLTFPVEWDFVCPKPATIAANKTAVLSLTFYGTSDDDCVAAYSVQP